MDAHLVGGLADFLYQRGGVLRRSGGGGAAVCMVRVSLFMALLSPGGAAPSGKTINRSYGLQCLSPLLSGPGVFLPEVLPGKEDRGAPFQDAVIDTGMGPGRAGS